MANLQISESIRRARQARGLTQAELAPLIGVTQGAISSWEQGNESPSFVHMLKLLLHLPELRHTLAREQVDLLVRVERALFADRCTCDDCSCHTLDSPAPTLPPGPR
ncbi:MAG: helix-turn-helix transcriptional regulator [Armatimonadota bacterium]|nr:helix-turn-helix transcriptional regulator [Armatimonadota bacterium]MDR7486752.1 helix-turn-helix transcriptional regulator [Armatimonadota bacterium]MDR7534268.1 helix-turn-helix transcriptional regulator [Armatimonadota bacterium]MDR7535381.1 helix-turn-helix transcriptional regulator [Armatimonadota bacterium]